MYSFAGGGLPPHIRTIAIVDVRQSDRVAGPAEGALRRDAQGAAAAARRARRAAGTRRRARARRRSQSYDADVPVSFSANPQQAVTARRRLQITIEIEIIDQSNGQVLFRTRRCAKKPTTTSAPRPTAASRRSRRSFRRSSKECRAIGDRAPRRELARLSVHAAHRRGGRLFRREHRRGVLALLPVPGRHAAGSALRRARTRNDQILAHLRAQRRLARPARRRAGASPSGATRTAIAIEAEYYERLELPMYMRDIHFHPHAEGTVLSVRRARSARRRS